MDHRPRDNDAGFAGDEDDPAPTPLEHSRQIGSRQPGGRAWYELDAETLARPEVAERLPYAQETEPLPGGRMPAATVDPTNVIAITSVASSVQLVNVESYA